MSMSRDARDQLIQRIIDATEEGKVTLWTERIAQLAKAAGFRTHLISWAGSPYIVTNNVIAGLAMDDHDRLAKLEDELNKLEG